MLGRVFLQILNMSFTASIVIACVMAVRILLQKAPKIFSYALWSVVLFRLICPFSFESMFSLLPTKANPISQDIVYMHVPKIDTGIAAINNSVNVILPAATPQTSVNPLQILVFIGSKLWLLGVAALLVYSLVTLLRLKKQLQDASLYQDNIFISSKIDTAFVIGIFFPKIYLPSILNDTERNYILLHEQTHIKRLDHIVKLISFLVLCVHWFNPFVWLAFFLSGKDIEMSCDEAVIKRLGNDVKKDYSVSLLTLATGRRIVGGTPLAFGEGDTKGRVKNVLNYKKPGFWVVLMAVISVVLVVIGLTTSPKEVPSGFAGVNATILKIDKDNQTMTVKGIDTKSPIGDNCIVSWGNATLQTVATNSEPREISIDDFAVGDYVVLFLEEIQESYPTRTKATTIQLQPTTTETVAAEYSIMKLGKNGEVLFKYSSETQSLADAIIRDALVKSAAWEGVDITTLEECYRIRQTITETQEVYDYYAYRLKNGTAVLQYGAVGQYSILSDGLYETLTKYIISPDIDGDAQSVKNTNYSLSLTAEELKQTQEAVQNYFTTEAPYYEGIVSIELMPDDYHLYKNPGIEGKYAAGNIIIYKVLTGRDDKDHNPERSVSVARDSGEADWNVINQGY